MNVLILDKGSRGGQCGFPYHYCKLGHKVYMIKPGEPDFPWANIPTWPRMLMKNSTGKRNFETHNLPAFDDFDFGEDRFLVAQNEELRQKMYESDVFCELITVDDITSGKIKINAIHTTDHCTPNLKDLLGFKKKYLPHAKWISSTFDPGNLKPFDITLQNAVRILPAVYENEYRDINSCDFYRHPFEFELLGVDTIPLEETSGFGSFNHNFSQRDPNFWELFSQLSTFVKENHDIHLENYGGNIRGCGADIKYDQDGPTGNLKTLSPRDAAKKFMSLRGIVHLKTIDWGGGVPAYARFSGTPMIVLKGYLPVSKMTKVWQHGFNCIEIDSPQDLYEAIVLLESNKEIAEKFGANAQSMNEVLFDQDYWDAWDKMLNNLC